MSSASAIRAGRAFVELFADDSKLVRGLRAAEKKVRAFGQDVRDMGLKIMGLGSMVLAPLIGMAKGFADTGSQIFDMAKRTGVSAEALSVLGYAAEQTGTDVNALEKGLRKMRKTIGDAIGGSGSAQAALARLGLTVKDLQNLAPDEQFKLIADRIDKIVDPALKASAAMAIFGTRIGPMLMPMLEGGAAKLKEFEDRARALGLVISTEDAAAGKKFGDVLKDLWLTIKMAGFAIGAALAPTLKDLAVNIAKAVVSVTQWLRKNGELVVSVMKIAAIVVAAGAALVVLGTVIGGLASVIGGVITIVTAASAIFGVLLAVIAALVTPIGLVIAALVALAAYIVYASGAGAKALAWLGDKFNILYEDATAALQGIGDALAAGDIGLAAKVFWLTLKLEWTRGVQYLKDAFSTYRTWLVITSAGLWKDFMSGAITFWEEFRKGWVGLTAFVRAQLVQLGASLKSYWEDFKFGAEAIWGWVKVKTGIESAESVTDYLTQREQEMNKVKQQIESEKISAQGEIANEALQFSADVNRELDQKQQELVKGYEDVVSGELAQYNQDLAGHEAELNAARKEWQDAIAEAKRKKEEKEAGGPEELKGPGKPDLSALGKMNIGDMLAEQVEKIGVRGTFVASAAAIRGLAGGDATDRIANATQQTAVNTKKIYDAIDAMEEPEFS